MGTADALDGFPGLVARPCGIGADSRRQTVLGQASSRFGESVLPSFETQLANEGFAERSRPPLRCCRPRSIDPRRVVPHVLRVAALQVCHPMALIVLMKTDDLAFDVRRASVRHFPILTYQPTEGAPGNSINHLRSFYRAAAMIIARCALAIGCFDHCDATGPWSHWPRGQLRSRLGGVILCTGDGGSRWPDELDRNGEPSQLRIFPVLTRKDFRHHRRASGNGGGGFPAAAAFPTSRKYSHSSSATICALLAA